MPSFIEQRKIQQARESTEINDFYIGLEGQLTVDVERWEIRLHDAITPGGHRILNIEQLRQLFLSIDSEFGQTSFSTEDVGFLVRAGHREYGLRTLNVSDGLTITNADGVNGNPLIGLDEAFVASLFSIPYAGLTGGNAGAYTLTIEGWDDKPGASFFTTFHVAADSGATLSINDATSRSLLTPNLNVHVNRVIQENTQALVTRIGSSYILIGLQHPSNIGIQPIDGLDATNVQDALAELMSKIGGISIPDVPPGALAWTFTNTWVTAGGTGQPLGSQNLLNIILEPGEAVLLHAVFNVQRLDLEGAGMHADSELHIAWKDMEGKHWTGQIGGSWHNIMGGTPPPPTIDPSVVYVTPTQRVQHGDTSIVLNRLGSPNNARAIRRTAKGSPVAV